MIPAVQLSITGRNFMPVLLGLILLLSLGGGLLVYLSKQGSPFSLVTAGSSPSVAPSPTSSVSPAVKTRAQTNCRCASGVWVADQIQNKINLGERE